MLKRSAWLLATALFFISLQACKGAATKSSLNSQSDAQTQSSIPASPQVAEETVPAPSKFNEALVGVIDQRLAIHMNLERKGDGLTGSYYYDRPGAFNTALRTLELKGRIDGDGDVVLTETSQNLESNKEQRTGEFRGKLNGVSANGEVRLQFTGVWVGGKDKKQAPFNLRQVQYDLGGLKLDAKKQESANKGLRYELATALPQLTGADTARIDAFNKATANFVAARSGEFKKSVDEAAREDSKSAAPKPSSDTPPNSLDVSYEVTAANKDFISILFSFFEYSGGAHPNTNTASFNFDLRRNGPLKLADLFAPDSNYLKVLSDYSVRELKKLQTVSSAEEGAGPKLENFHSWNITPTGLKITFDPYQVGAYAAGEHEVVVPYSVLRPILRQDGPLAQFTK